MKRYSNNIGRLVLIPLSILAGLNALIALAQTAPRQSSTDNSQVVVPARPESPLYKGEQGKQRSGIQFDRSTRTVTITLRVQDPNGYFLPNIRRDNFAVYEDGVRQKNVTVEVEHSPVSIALLMEFGGRFQSLDKALSSEVAEIGHQLLDFIGRDDKVAIFEYGSTLKTLADFSQPHDVLDGVFNELGSPPSSENNFYDALLQTLNRMRDIGGRKAVIAISTGYDTFSKASDQQVLQAVQDLSTPIYTIGLLRYVERETDVYGPDAPFAQIDWNRAEERMEMLAKTSGGRAYVPESDIQIAAIYDDIMENLRLRYVITYVSSNPATSGPPRHIRVELIDPRTGGPLKIRDSNGRVITPRIFVKESYSPDTAGN